ncbi:MAG: dienelactone hydrolase family protein [Chthoniobacterales bacterium]
MEERTARFVRLMVLLLSGLCAWSGCAAARPGNAGAVTVARKNFESGGAKILVDVYTPRAAGRHVPILVLHGAGGMLFDGPEMTRVAERLATAGFESYQVHYFDRTHTWFARQAVLLKLFPTWLGTAQDAVNWVHTQRPDAPKIGIFGYSLGAFAAIETARRDPSIGAVVEEAGGFWHGHPEGQTRQPLPPILVIHGTVDTRVPNEKYTQPLLEYLRTHGDPFEKKFYPGEGHVFSADAAAKVREQAAEFFARHLR